MVLGALASLGTAAATSAAKGATSGGTGGPTAQRLIDESAATSGNNVVNVGNPMKNMGDILKYVNQGSPTNQSNPNVIPQSPIENLNKPGGLPGNANVGIQGESPNKVRMTGFLGIGLAGLAIFLVIQNVKA